MRKFSRYIREIKILQILLLIFAPHITSGQDSTANNRILVAFSLQNYLNNFNIVNDRLYPNPIHTRNTIGYYIGFDFERTTRRKLVFNFGLRTGVRSHDITLRQDLSTFDLAAIKNLQNKTFNDRIICDLWYIDPSILLGYKASLSKRWYGIAKIGVYVTQYINGSYYGKSVNAVYYTDDNSELREVRFLTYEGVLGEPKQQSKKFKWFDPTDFLIIAI